MRGEGCGEQWRQRRYRTVHQPGEPRLHILQHEHAPARLVLFGAHIGAEDLVGQSGRQVLVRFFRLGEIAEQPAYADILGLSGGLDVKLLGLELHGLDFLADGVERQVLGQPDRTAFQEALDVFAADRRQMRPKALFIEFEQHVPMAAFFLGHLLEDLGGVRVAFGEVFGEGHVNAAVLLF